MLAAGIAHISMLLETALVIDDAEVGEGVVTVGSVVEVRDQDSGSASEAPIDRWA